MALLTTVLEVVGVIAAMAAFLWFSTMVESRQIGVAPRVIDTPDLEGAVAPDAAVESAQAI